MPELLQLAAALWILALLLALAGGTRAARLLVGLGALAGTVGALAALPSAPPAITLHYGFAGEPLRLQYSPQALWLLGFGLWPAALAAWLCTPERAARRGWLAGAAISLLGALGVCGIQNGYGFLIAWELMSLGGAVMLLSERLAITAGRASLYMLALLEVGAVAVLLALLLLSRGAGGSMDFATFGSAALALTPGLTILIGLLLLFGFGAKLGLLPFYEWYPNAYASGSGATGIVMSGAVLNAAYFALSRGLSAWLPTRGGDALFALGVVVTWIAVFSAALTALYAFQQDDWRRLLAYSSAENASIAVAALGASLLFRQDGHAELAGLAWTVGTLHLSGHALAKGGLFICADGVRDASGSYRLVQRGWIRRSGLAFGVGALFAAMSLAAMPPQIGFATEWLTFQTVFQGFHLSGLGGRLALAIAGALLALTAAVALATSVKAFGIGLLGTEGAAPPAGRVGIARRYGWSALLMGLSVLTAAVGLPVWLRGLDAADVAQFGVHAARLMSTRWLIVPLTDTFAFISPSKLAIAMPLLAIVPLLLALTLRRHPVRHVPIWYGGTREDPRVSSTTALTFANAMRVFYSFIYRPTLDTAREHRAVAYFVQKLELEHALADIFEPWLFAPMRRLVWRLAGWLRNLQSGDLNFYMWLIAVLLVIILALTLR